MAKPLQRSSHRIRRASWPLAVVVFARIVLAGTGFATPYERGGNVDLFFGAYRETIPIVVPPYHGLEPKLSISYSSSAGDGMVGMGWNLGGLSELEEINQHFELDGQWLIGCSKQTDVLTGPTLFGPRSPSCFDALGHMSTLSESYLRIVNTGNTITVLQPNGTRTDYTKAGSSKKWLITAMTDTSGNTVTYRWHGAADGFRFNAPSSITYNGTVITFYYEPRTTPATYAENGRFETLDQQLTTIDVCVQLPGTLTPCALERQDAHRARAYSLRYGTSQTGRPLLTDFTMFGKDALLTAAGKVTSGHATPSFSFGWNNPISSFTTTSLGDLPDWGHDWIVQMVDFNGDGRADLCRDQAGGPNGWNLKCAISTGSGFVDEWKGQIQNWGDDHSGAWVDWDGDGKTDYCRIVNREIWCAFSTGAAGDVTAINDRQVGPAFSPGDEGYDGMRWFVDWNGDGRADFCRALNRNPNPSTNLSPRDTLQCAFSQGDASAGYRDQNENVVFDSGGQDLRGEPYSRAIVDFNGDGVMDFCRLLRRTTYELWCNLGSRYADDMDRGRPVGAVVQLMGSINDPGAADSQWWADVNGDGKVDYCRLTGNGDLRCAVSTQTCGTAPCNATGINAFTDVVWARLPNAGWALSRRFGDINGDGKADFCWSGGGTVSCQLSTGLSSVAARPTNAPSEGLYERNWMVDWNGTGRLQYCSNTGSTGGAGSKLTCVGLNTGQLLDLMTSVSNGIGGTTTVAYTPSSAWSGCGQAVGNNPPVMPTVTTVTTLDGTTRYAYCGGVIDRYTGRFLGFRWTRATDPCVGTETACPYTETTYRVDYRWPTKPSGVFRYGGSAAALIEKTLYTYADTTSTPYRSELLTESRFLYENNNFTQQDITREYDRYGNLTRLLDSGIVADGINQPQNLTGDDRALELEYRPNTTDYILNKPASITGREGLDPGAKMISGVRYIYDSASDWDSAPTKGHVTKTLKWLNTTNSYIGSTAGAAPQYDTVYDAWGNVLSAIDAENNVTTYQIDPTYHQYIVKVTLPPAGARNVAQSFTTDLSDWDVQCGIKLREIQDANGGIDTRFTYDPLCRKTRTDFPGGDYEKITYNDLGLPTLQNTEYSRPGPSGEIWERRQFDGLGRTTKVTRTGPDTASGIDIVSAEYLYNARGKLKEVVRPHYSNDPPLPVGFYDRYPFDAVSARTFYDYDIRDRLLKVTLPDKATRTTTYWLRQTTETDESGHVSVTNFDLRGRPTMRCSAVNATCLSDIVYYGYDARGNLSTVQQLQQNGTVWAYWRYDTDSLARMVSSSDPDAGARRYTYDAIGRLIDEADANGGHTHYGYDALGRRTSKTINYVEPCQPTPLTPCLQPVRCLPVLRPCPKPPETVTWRYDEPTAGQFNSGRLTSSTDPSGTATYGYDRAGNLIEGTRSVDGTPYSFHKEYDTGGRLLATTYPDGSTVGTSAQPLRYDSAGRLGAVPGFVESATYNAEGTLTSYYASTGATTTINVDATTGRIKGYATTGPNVSTIDGTIVLGTYAASRKKFQDFHIQQYAVSPGQTITATTCGDSVPGASGSGDTLLRLLDPSGTQVASDGKGAGKCRLLSTLTYLVPPGGSGLYTVRAGCVGAAACSGTVVVQVKNPQKNLAINKPATQSSNPDRAAANRAVDGNTDGNSATGSVARTGPDAQAWWSVDLQSWYYQIDYINIWNRTDCCAALLVDFDVLVYNELTNSTSTFHVAGPAGRPTRVDVNQPGSRVSIRLNGSGPLQLAEVEVIGRDTLILAAQAPLLHQATISRDVEGRIKEIDSNRFEENWTYAYSPNALHQLTSASNEFIPLRRTFVYDTSGNLTSGPLGTYSYPTDPNPIRPHAVSAVGGTTYSYDNNGQRITAGGQTLTWDGGRLIGVDGVTQYVYDADGYRLKKIANGTQTIYLGDDYEITNGVHTKYISLGGRLIAKQSGGASVWLYSDYQGSVLFGVDDIGHPIIGMGYDAYGQPLTSGTADGRGFTGQRRDEAGLLYLHARFYDPAIGRFLSPDPAPLDRVPGELDRYGYARNNPVNRTDIDGLGFWEDAGSWITHAAGDVAKALQSIPDVPILGIGIGNTLALLPSSINDGGRGDWPAFGKAVAAQAIVAAAITLDIVAIYNPAIGPGVAAFNSMAVPFALTLLYTGDVTAAVESGLSAIPLYELLKSGKQLGMTRANEGGDWRSVESWSGGVLENDYPTWADAKATLHIKERYFGSAAAIVGNIVSANAYIPKTFRDHAIGTAPSSQLSSGTGALFGYGYAQSSDVDKRLPIPW